MKIKAVVEFDAVVDGTVEEGEKFGVEIDVEKLVGEVVKVKSGDYDNLLMGTIIEAEEIE